MRFVKMHFPPQSCWKWRRPLKGTRTMWQPRFWAECNWWFPDGPQLYTAPIPVPQELHAILFIPEARIATSDARAVLPRQVSVADAVFNMGRVALLVAGMALNRPEYLKVATQDKLHPTLSPASVSGHQADFCGSLGCRSFGRVSFGQRLHGAGLGRR